MRAKLEARMEEVKKEFDALTAKFKELSEQRDGLNRQLSQIQARQIELKGSAQELEKLLNDESVNPIPTPGPEKKKETASKEAKH